MQVTAKSESEQRTDTSDPSDSDYIGRHRPRRLGALRQRVRTSQLAGREGSLQAD